jgi:hypothetical protein
LVEVEAVLVSMAVAILVQQVVREVEVVLTKAVLVGQVSLVRALLVAQLAHSTLAVAVAEALLVQTLAAVAVVLAEQV